MMSFRGSAIVGGLTAALAMPVAADADQSMTTGAVNMRGGAGIEHARITTLPAGASVWIHYCVEGWCLAHARGLEGWVSARYLLSASGHVESYQPPTITAPTAPAVKFPFVMPDRGFHDYGLGDQHKFQRKNR